MVTINISYMFKDIFYYLIYLANFILPSKLQLLFVLHARMHFLSLGAIPHDMEKSLSCLYIDLYKCVGLACFKVTQMVSYLIYHSSFNMVFEIYSYYHIKL